MTALCEPGEHRLGKDGTCLDCGDDRPGIGGRLDRQEYAALYEVLDELREIPKPDKPFRLPSFGPAEDENQ
jgi:hypothetical protein